jgi:hypothetical protein
MPVHIAFETELVVVVVDGDFTADEFRRKGKAALDTPGLGTPVPVLVDFSGAAGMSRRSADDLRETVAIFAERAAEIRRVALVASRDLEYGFMRMGAAFAQTVGLDVSVFRSRGDARSWLAAEPPLEA